MSNVNGGWNGSTCGGTAHGFPQRTIYDSLAESNKTFKQYINLTTVTNWTGGQSTGSFSGFDGVNFPDTMMDGVARYARSSFFNYSTFFADAAAHFCALMAIPRRARSLRRRLADKAKCCLATFSSSVFERPAMVYINSAYIE